MKASLVFLAAFLSIVSARAQGTVRFSNTASTNYRLWTNDLTGATSNLLCCGQHRIGLYASTDLAAPESGLNLVALATNSALTPLAGYFNGGGALPLPGLANGATIRFQLRAWSLSAGMSYEEALVAAAVDPLGVTFGYSPLGTTTLGGGLVPPASLFGTSPGLLSQGFCVGPFACIPEPSAGSLAVLGTMAIALFARRRYPIRNSNPG